MKRYRTCLFLLLFLAMASYGLVFGSGIRDPEKSWMMLGIGPVQPVANNCYDPADAQTTAPTF